MKKQLFSNTLIFIVLTISLLNFSACHDMKKKADLIIFNAVIYSPDSVQPGISCIAVKEGKILAVGNDAEVRSRYWARENINAKNAVVYPGFIDAHCHFFGLASSLQSIDLSAATSFAEIIEMLKMHQQIHPKGWIVGRGWDQNRWAKKAFPDNEQLNLLWPSTPVILTRIDGHAVLANQAAIAASHLELPVKPGEAILRNGKLTGIFLETAADKIKEAVPPLSVAELDSLLLAAQKMCHAAGLTGVADAGLEKKDILLIDSLQKAGRLKLRIDAWLSPTDENLNYFLNNGIYKTPFLRVGAIKLYADGALGSRGALLLKPYSDAPGSYGITVTGPARLLEICRLAYNFGYQVNTHAIGDSAVRMVLHTYAKVLGGVNDRRWRVEHAQVVNENDFELFGKYSVIPSVQATHATSDMLWAPARLGPDRVKNAYAYKKLLAQNKWMPNGTDFPIEGIEPLHTFYAAVARKNLDKQPPEGFQPENAISRTEALKSITLWAAKASFAENERGSITPGKLADLTILDKDIIKSSEDELLNAKVLYTIVNGEIVYKSKK